MSNHKKHAELIKNHASKKLRLNLRILSVVYIILFLITLYDLIIAQTIFSQVLIAMIIGLVAGIISARMYKITWDSHEAEVIGRIDIYGVIVLILFVLFELNRSRIAELFTDGASLGSIGFVLITSALFGRIFGTARKILRVLDNEKII
jgi:cytochrome c oxidase subunit IV